MRGRLDLIPSADLLSDTKESLQERPLPLTDPQTKVLIASLLISFLKTHRSQMLTKQGQ